MAESDKTHYGKIGFFVLGGAALIACAAVYLGGVGSKKHEVLAETFFSNSVSGLDVGSAVNFRGVRLGSVKRISFVGAEYTRVADPMDNRNIYVEMALDARLLRFIPDAEPRAALQHLVEKGLHATVTASGVTGLSRIELNVPRTPVPEEKHSWRPRHVLIPPAPSLLDSAADSAEKLLTQMSRVDFVEVFGNLAKVCAKANDLLGNVNALVEEQRGNVAQILDGARDAAENLRALTGDLKDNPSRLIRAIDAERLRETR